MSGGGGSSNTTVQKAYTPEEEEMRKYLMNEGQRIYGQASPQFTTAGYPGAQPTPVSAETEAARQAMTATATGSGSQLSTALGQATQFGLKDVLYPESNPALQATIDTATRKIGQAYTDPNGVLSNIRSNFTAGNSAGTSTRESIAGGLAGRSYLDAIGDVTGRISSEGYKAGLDTFGKTLALAPSTYSTMLAPAQTLATVGGSREAEAAGQEAYAASGREWQLNAPWMGLQNLSQIFAGTANPATSSTGTATAASNPAMSAAGGAMAGWALGAAEGSIGGPMGMAIGAIAGLILSQ